MILYWENSKTKYIATQSKGFSSLAFSSTWQLFSLRIIDCVFPTVFCRNSIEQTAGTQMPNWRFPCLKKVFFSSGLIKSIEFTKLIVKDTYSAIVVRGIISVSLFDWKMFGIALIILKLNGFSPGIPLKSIANWPKQYLLLYNVPLRSMWKHSENDPNDCKFPSKIPDGSFPHASRTENRYNQPTDSIRNIIHWENLKKIHVLMPINLLSISFFQLCRVELNIPNHLMRDFRK